MDLSDRVLRAFASSHAKVSEPITVITEVNGVRVSDTVGARGVQRPWVVNTERPKSLEERIAALEERIARLERQEP